MTELDIQDDTTKSNYNSSMEFEWDENKRLSNIQKHGVDFEDIPTLFDGDTITLEDTRFDYGK